MAVVNRGLGIAKMAGEVFEAALDEIGEVRGLMRIAVPLSECSVEATESCQPLLAEGQREVPAKISAQEMLISRDITVASP